MRTAILLIVICACLLPGTATWAEDPSEDQDEPGAELQLTARERAIIEALRRGELPAEEAAPTQDVEVSQEGEPAASDIPQAPALRLDKLPVDAALQAALSEQQAAFLPCVADLDASTWGSAWISMQQGAEATVTWSNFKEEAVPTCLRERAAGLTLPPLPTDERLRFRVVVGEAPARG